MKPEGARYEHPCTNCKFLGQWHQYDLYACVHGEPGEQGVKFYKEDPALLYNTILARYGDDGPEETNGLIFGYRQNRDGKDTPLAEAYRRAVEQQLWDPTELQAAMDYWVRN